MEIKRVHEQRVNDLCLFPLPVESRRLCEDSRFIRVRMGFPWILWFPLIAQKHARSWTPAQNFPLEQVTMLACMCVCTVTHLMFHTDVWSFPNLSTVLTKSRWPRRYLNKVISSHKTQLTVQETRFIYSTKESQVKIIKVRLERQNIYCVAANEKMRTHGIKSRCEGKKKKI